MDEIASDEVAAVASFEHKGPVRTVSGFSLLPAADQGRGSVVFFGDAAFLDNVNAAVEAVVVTTPDLATAVAAPQTLLLADQPPRAAFYGALEALARGDRFEVLQGHVSATASVAPSAVIGKNVYIDDFAVIEPGVVLEANTYIGRNARVKANAVIGGDGFEVVGAGSNRHVVAHVGGVWIDDGAQVGSATCVDRGLLGEFTYVGAGTIIDNLVHFAHSARCGPASTIVACCMIGGSAAIGERVWIGPNSSVNNSIRVGDYSYIGTGSVVVRDVRPHTLAYGSPARAAARLCRCGTKLMESAGRWSCPSCANSYVFDEPE
jgi:UDP-3-O-[3-hydroxymyristoyl] glucosamine N-acyltransferase